MDNNCAGSALAPNVCGHSAHPVREGRNLMDTDAAVRAYLAGEREMIAHHIDTHGVRVTYVGGGEDGECECCRLEAQAATNRAERRAADRAERRAATKSRGSAKGPQPLSVPFGYTTGLHGKGHPELVVLGLPMDLTAGLLNATAQQVLAGQQLVPGERVPHLAPPVLVEEIPNPGMVVLAANTYYGRSPHNSVPAHQLTWADLDSRFPWEEGHNTGREQPRPGTYRA